MPRRRSKPAPLKRARTKQQQQQPTKKLVAKQKQEIGLLGRALRGLGGLGGAAAGAMIGMPGAGRQAGTDLGASISRWLGAGDYEVSRNSIVAKASDGIPMMHRSNQSIIVRHREFICTISGSTDYTVQRRFVINPGLDDTFPWLSGVARRFQEWDMKGAVFHYVPTSGQAVSSTNSALGAVMIQTSYRSSDSAPASKVELLNEFWASEAVPSDCFVHPLECDPKENPFNVHYTRSSSASVVEPLMYDLGVTTIATQGMQSTNDVGDLWLTYEVELKKPLITSSAVSSPLSYSVSYAPTSQSVFFNGAATVLFDGGLAITAAAATVTLPDSALGYFLVMGKMSSSISGTNVSWTGAPTLVNCTEFQVFLGGRTITNLPGSESADSATYATVVLKTDVSTVATLTFPAMTGNSSTPGSFVLTVTKLGDP
jgi:hypothetical protein